MKRLFVLFAIVAVVFSQVKLKTDEEELADVEANLKVAQADLEAKTKVAEMARQTLADARAALGPFVRKSTQTTVLREQISKHAVALSRSIRADKLSLYHTANAASNKKEAEEWNAIAADHKTKVLALLPAEAKAAFETLEAAITRHAAAHHGLHRANADVANTKAQIKRIVERLDEDAKSNSAIIKRLEAEVSPSPSAAASPAASAAASPAASAAASPAASAAASPAASIAASPAASAAASPAAATAAASGSTAAAAASDSTAAAASGSTAAAASGSTAAAASGSTAAAASGSTAAAAATTDATTPVVQK